MSEALPGRRKGLQAITPCPSAHAGLWFERYLPELGQDGGGQGHLETVAKLRMPAPYPRFFSRWRAALAGLAPDCVLSEAEVLGRMVVGLGAESILEVSIALHRTWGVPCIPGSALKGLAAHSARWCLEEPWERSGEPYRVLFGDTEAAGYVTFHDALWIPPDSGDELPLDLDVMTVHHPDYYGDGSTPPADWDNPTPIPFLSARGRYLLAIAGPRPWAEAATDLLAGALAEEGVGAKTAAGYGRLRLVRDEPRKAGPSFLDRATWEKLARSVGMGNVAQEVPRLFEQVPTTEHGDLARVLVEALGKKSLRSEKHRDKDWVKRLLSLVGAGEMSGGGS